MWFGKPHQRTSRNPVNYSREFHLRPSGFFPSRIHFHFVAPFFVVVFMALATSILPATDDETYEYFIAVSHHFKLGLLPTEQSNPCTTTLSQTLQGGDIAAGLGQLKDADSLALRQLLDRRGVLVPQLQDLARAIHHTLESGHQVILEGCGATGRLALCTEVLCRDGLVDACYRDKVKGFMAGGDAALIRSIEKFEDRVEYGARQLHDIGFAEGDLLLAVTEGGETPFVIAACEEAVKVSASTNPFFLYCNPDDVLRRVAERSARVLDNPRIHKINLCVGPMAITGSTRMQATTVQLFACAVALQHHRHPERIEASLMALQQLQADLPYDRLAPFTSAEAEMYRDKELFLYRTNPGLLLTVMTDTTERAPTFSLPPFENFDRAADAASQPYLHLLGKISSLAAWTALFAGRAPRPLEWVETQAATGLNAILGYDFSDHVLGKRQHKAAALPITNGAVVNRVIDVGVSGEGLRFAIESKGIRCGVPLPLHAMSAPGDPLLLNLAAKMLLNAHSTAVMGILGRYEGNVMTWVRPSNNKLIDRSARYVALLLQRRKTGTLAVGGSHVEKEEEALPSYEQIVKAIFDLRPTLRPDQPIVLAVVDALCREGGGAAAL